MTDLFRYFIYVDDSLKEVSESIYDTWAETELEKYSLPDYALLIDGNQYSIETLFKGAIDKGEEPLPFILFYFEDVWQVGDAGLSKTEDNDTIEYFDSFEALKTRRDELIALIEAKGLKAEDTLSE